MPGLAAAMTKRVSASEFEARCLRLIAGTERDGEPVAITRRGKVAAEAVPKQDEAEPDGWIGSIKGMVTWAPNVDPTAPVLDLG